MLIGVPIITYIMVVVIGVGKEHIVFGKNETAAQVYIGKMNVLRIP